MENVNPPPTYNRPVLPAGLRTRSNQELHELHVISDFIDSRLESLLPLMGNSMSLKLSPFLKWMYDLQEKQTLPEKVLANLKCSTGYEYGLRQTDADGWSQWGEISFDSMLGRNVGIKTAWANCCSKKLLTNPKWGMVMLAAWARRRDAAISTQVVDCSKGRSRIYLQLKVFLMAAAADPDEIDGSQCKLHFDG
ncbi:hypothetical protein Tco_1176558 [Tanacetum coccineum]